MLVRAEGLEPSRREALAPKASVYTSFTTPASLVIMAIFSRRVNGRVLTENGKQSR